MTVPLIKWGGRLIDGAHRPQGQNLWLGRSVVYAERATDYLTHGPLTSDCELMPRLRQVYFRRPNDWSRLLDQYEELLVTSPEAIFYSDGSLPASLATLFTLSALQQRGADLSRCSLYLESPARSADEGERCLDPGSGMDEVVQLWNLVTNSPVDLLHTSGSDARPATDEWRAILGELLYQAPDDRGIDAIDEAILAELRSAPYSVEALIDKVLAYPDLLGSLSSEHVLERIVALSEHRLLRVWNGPKWRNPPIRLGPLESADLRGLHPKLTQFGRRVLNGTSRIPHQYLEWRWVGGLRASDFLPV